MAISAAIRNLQPAIRILSAVLACVGVGGYLLWLGSGVLVKEGNWVGVDFHVYYAVGHVLSQGGDPYSVGISPPYVYPPFLGILVLPLSALPVNAATIIWKVLQHLCLLTAGALLISFVPKGVRPLAVGVLLFGWLLVPVQDEILLGESNSLVLLLVVGAIWLTARAVEREVDAGEQRVEGSMLNGQGDTLMAAAGILLALAACIKVLPLLLVAYFWWRGPRRVAISATIGFVALQLASLAATASTIRYWFVELPSLFGQTFPFLDNQSLNAAISRALLPTDPSLPNMQLLGGDLLRSLFTWLANLLALTLAFLVIRSTLPPAVAAKDKETYRVTFLLEISLVLLTIHLVSGSTWMHHLIDLCVPVCGLLGAWWTLGMRNGGWGMRNVDRRELAEQPAAGDHRPSRKAYSAFRIPHSAFILLAVAFLLLFRRAADWLSFFDGLSTGSPQVAWVISNSALWAVLLIWVAVALRAKSVLQLVA
jgi:Glycosyltransferase family 87